MNIIHNLSNYSPNIRENFLTYLTAQQKKIMVIATIALGCLVVYYLTSRYCFKAQPLNSPTLLNSNKPKHPLSVIQLSQRYANKEAPICNIKIDKLEDKIKASNFEIKDYKIQDDGIVEFLVEYHAQGHPEIQAVWDEKNAKLYLVGGKTDAPVGSVECFSLAKANWAWIRLDLNTLDKKGEDISIYARLPAIYAASPNFSKRTKSVDGEDELIVSIYIA